MNLYFDTEFTGLRKNTTLISIGIVSENNETFYAELTDYDSSQVDYWINENVISNLKLNKSYRTDSGVFVKGDSCTVRDTLISWLSKYNNEQIQFVSDVSHYDFVLLIDLLFVSALSMPDNIVPYCYDINSLIADRLGISFKAAFDVSRLDLSGKKDLELHNSLDDAMMIKEIYEKLN